MAIAPNRITLTQHIQRKQFEHPEATGHMSALLTQIGVAGKVIQAQVRRAGLIDVWGGTGDENVQGETVQKLDRISQDALVGVLSQSGSVAVMVSEEENEVIEVAPEHAGPYVVVFDPLDGSSNVEANVSIGTIFGIYKRKDEKEVLRSDTMQPGTALVAAGYIIYGSSTVFVYSDGETVDCFTLDPGVGEYFLTRENVKMPQATKVFSTNEGNRNYWPKWVQPYVESVHARNDADKRRVTFRHIGSLVADFHRNLLYGGIFLYPKDMRTGKGKLRMLYECYPMAFIAEVAGGAATDGSRRMLEIEPDQVHARSSFVVGPKEEVAEVTRFFEEYGE